MNHSIIGINPAI